MREDLQDEVSLEVTQDYASFSTSIDTQELEEPPPRLFPRFPNLPSEIRVMIWKQAAQDSTTLRPTVVRQIPYAPYMAKEMPPKLLGVNREARFEASRVYTIRTITFDDAPPMVLFFNPGVRTLFLDAQPDPALQQHPENQCYCARKGYHWIQCLCILPPRKSLLGVKSSVSECPCPHATIENRHLHLLNRFSQNRTTQISSLALYYDPPAGMVLERVKQSFPHTNHVQFLVQLPKSLEQTCTLTDLWLRYREPVASQGSDWNDTDFQLWVKDREFRCWWKLKDQQYPVPVWCPDYNRPKESRQGVLDLNDLLDGGL